MQLTFRQMKVGDLAAAFAVRLSTIENAVTMEELEEIYDITPELLAEAMQSHVKGWLCEDGETAVGFAMGDRTKGEVQVIAVRPDYERNGIGKHLLKQVQNWLFAAAYEEIWLLANPDPDNRAYGFYRTLGWRATGKMVGEDEIMVMLRSDHYPDCAK